MFLRVDVFRPSLCPLAHSKCITPCGNFDCNCRILCKSHLIMKIPIRLGVAAADLASASCAITLLRLGNQQEYHHEIILEDKNSQQQR